MMIDDNLRSLAERVSLTNDVGSEAHQLAMSILSLAESSSGRTSGAGQWVGEITSTRAPFIRYQDEIMKCFAVMNGAAVATDKRMRLHDFLRSTFAMAQSCGGTFAEVAQIAFEIFNLSSSEVQLQAGRVAASLAALCAARGIDLEGAATAYLRHQQSHARAFAQSQEGRSAAMTRSMAGQQLVPPARVR